MTSQETERNEAQKTEQKMINKICQALFLFVFAIFFNFLSHTFCFAFSLHAWPSEKETKKKDRLEVWKYKQRYGERKKSEQEREKGKKANGWKSSLLCCFSELSSQTATAVFVHNKSTGFPNTAKVCMSREECERRKASRKC